MYFIIWDIYIPVYILAPALLIGCVLIYVAYKRGDITF